MIDIVAFDGCKTGGASGVAITSVLNFSALPDPTTVPNSYYWCEETQGTKWLPLSVGGTFYNSGLYYSNGTDWQHAETPFQATLAEVNTGTNMTRFVTPYTFSNSDKIVNSFQKNVDDTDDITEGVVNLFASDPTFNEIAWDVTNDSLPVTSTSVNVLNIDFENFNGDIDLTGQLPVNLKIGARVTLRKVDSTNGRIIFDDGVILYNFIKKEGEYLTLYWTGIKYII